MQCDCEEGGSHSAVCASACCCCSLLRMMLMMSPSCSFMCSISRSLLVDSKPQMQQQNSSTQYSMPGPGAAWPLRDWLWGCGGSFPWGLGDPPGQWAWSGSTAAVPSAVGVGSGSAETGALSFDGGGAAGRSATDSSTADNF